MPAKKLSFVYYVYHPQPNGDTVDEEHVQESAVYFYVSLFFLSPSDNTSTCASPNHTVCYKFNGLMEGIKKEQAFARL